MGFVTCFLKGASQEIKVKLNESWQLKFYQVKQLKENPAENSAEKTLKKTRKLMNSETFRQNKKRKEKKKYSNSKKFVSWTLSQTSSSKLH